MSRQSGPSRSNTRSLRPSHHANNSRTLFKNPWPSAAPPAWTELLSTPFPLAWYTNDFQSHAKARKISVVKPDWGASFLSKSGIAKTSCVIGTWLGHAGCLAEIPVSEKGESVRLLFDPIFSMRAGPTQYTGPGRFNASPCTVAELPGADAVFISHNHYDHLDLFSIKALLKNFPKAKYFVPLGHQAWLESTGVPTDRIFELDWWDQKTFTLAELGCGKSEGSIKFTCLPAQHNSGRGAMDQNSSLWCGWVAEHFSSSTRKSAIYHAGDTGYRRTATSEAVCPAFKQIGEKFGGFDLSFIPIWRGGTLGFISAIGLRLSHQDIPSQFHGSPADAIDMHFDVKSRNTVGIHFGTFIGSENESYEAVVEFALAKENKGVGELEDGKVKEDESGRAGTLDIGQSLVIELNELTI